MGLDPSPPPLPPTSGRCMHNAVHHICMQQCAAWDDAVLSDIQLKSTISTHHRILAEIPIRHLYRNIGIILGFMGCLRYGVSTISTLLQIIGLFCKLLRKMTSFPAKKSPIYNKGLICGTCSSTTSYECERIEYVVATL